MKPFLRHRPSPTAVSDSAPEAVSSPVILGTPKVGEPLAYLSATFSGNPTPSVTHTWMLDNVSVGASYTPLLADDGKAVFVRATATNRAGSKVSASAVAAIISASVATLPGQPTALASTGISANGASLTWTAPGTGGTPTDYLVEYKASASGAWLVLTDATTPTTGASLTDLLASTSYDVRVSAYNAAGYGAVSATHTFSTVAATGGSDIAVTWDAPAYDGDGSALADLASYKVYWGTVSGGPYPNSVTVAAPATNYTITAPGSGTWFVVVVAVDTSGNESMPGPELQKVIA